MTSPPGSPVALPTTSTPGQPAVAVVVLAENGAVDEETLAALDRQVYVATQRLIVGAAAPPQTTSPSSLEPGSTIEGNNPELVDSPDQVLNHLKDEIALVWWIHGDTRPRPDALRALVEETVRHDASIAGSKILVLGEDDRLGSVGEATDVFGEPYSGLDPGELDLEQYDVVREVAFVSPVSLLVRRDLLRGLRGLDPALPLEAAGLDLSQRGRLAGGRVIVVPSSEVFHASDCAALRPGWRQLAGRQKAMLNAYSFITLVWVLPVGMLVGLVDGFGQLILGRIRPLGSHILSWLWNIARLPSTVESRQSLRRIRQVRDEELFRFQVRGSVRLRRTLTELSERFTRVIESGESIPLAERAVDVWRRPTVVLSVLSALAVVVGTRHIWFGGPPQVGFSLYSAPNGVGILASYGGGWSAAGLGSAQAAPPVVALGSLIAAATGGDAGIAMTLLTLAAIVSGLLGMSRVAKRAGASVAGSYVAAWVYVAGAAVAALAGAGLWPLLLAVGPLPWALDAVLAPGGTSWRRRLGRIARGGLAAGLTAVAYPPLLVVIPVVGGLWAIVSRRRAAFSMGLAVTAVGGGLIAPFVMSGDILNLLNSAPLPSIDPAWLWPVSIVIATGLGALLVKPPRLPGVALGGALAGGGWLLGLLPHVVPGVGLAALLAAAVGAGLLAAALVETEAVGVWRQVLALAGVAMLALPALATVAEGRAGLPPDRWSKTLAFVEALSPESVTGRVLLIGPQADLPGSSRLLGNVGYRLIDRSVPTLDEAYLPAIGAGDVALAAALERSLVRGVDLRPGDSLADFGIHWVVVMPNSGLSSEALDRQIDLAERSVDPDLAVYENLVASGRAVGDGGISWFWNGNSYEGAPFPGRIRLADSAHPRWGPEWASADGWANSVSGATGEATFQPDRLARAAGFASFALFWCVIAAAWWGRAISTGQNPPPRNETTTNELVDAGAA